MTVRGVAVIKVGGSILRDSQSYERVARRLAGHSRQGPTRVVVSAAFGITDALDDLATTARTRDAWALIERHSWTTGVPVTAAGKDEFWRGLRETKAGTRERLLAWGERESAAALQVHLARLGWRVPIEELRVHHVPPIRSAIVPGFYLRDHRDRVRCFPRGGSDISAVLVAYQFRASSARFWKEGGGILSDGGVLAEVDSSVLLKRLAGTVRPLHPAAVLLAARRGIDLILEDPFGHHGSTRIRSGDSERPTGMAIPTRSDLETPIAADSRPLAVSGGFR